MTEFFLMGGYAFYVWTSFAITAAVLIIQIIVSRKNHHKILSELLDAQHPTDQKTHE